MTFPGGRVRPESGRSARKSVATWLLVCCVLVFAMVVVGGITRLTHSGLSIVEWQPIVGSIPPLDRRVERLQQIDGAMPRLSAIPQGCAYNPRCPQVFDRCRVERPELMNAGTTQAACWLHAGSGA